MQPRLHAKSKRHTTRPGDAIPRREWLTAWATVAANSFGGPAGQIAVMHDEIVERRGWIGERRFLHALNYCMLLPGPEAQQLATYLGWLLRGPTGGLVAGGLFILPGFASIMVLSIVFALYGDIDWVAGLFFGITAAVLVIVANAVLRIGRRVIRNRAMLLIAAGSFVAIFVFELPFPAIVVAAAAIGLAGSRLDPESFTIVAGHDESQASNDADALVGDDDIALARPTVGRAVRVLGVGLATWFGPVVLIAFAVGWDSVLIDIARLFSTAAVLTFGGAYSVLAYISTAAVTTHGWLAPEDMISGLGMAETTPGPLIQVVQFVGFMGAYGEPGGMSALEAGIAGSLVATWVTFVPSFLWIFLGAPFIEYLRGRPALTAALSTITAAVVGVVLNLAVWFGLFTLFDEVGVDRRFGAVLYRPDLGSLDLAALAIAALSAIAIFAMKRPTLQVVAFAALAGIAQQLLFT